MLPKAAVTTPGDCRFCLLRSTPAQTLTLLNAVIFFLFWLAVLCVGADYSPPSFVAVVLTDLVVAGLVYRRVPAYLA